MGSPISTMSSSVMRVAQITERGDPVAEVSERLGVSQHRCTRRSGSWRRWFPYLTR